MRTNVSVGWDVDRDVNAGMDIYVENEVDRGISFEVEIYDYDKVELEVEDEVDSCNNISVDKDFKMNFMWRFITM